MEIVITVAFLASIVVIRSVLVVPPGMTFVIERLGRYHRVLQSGFHIVTPFVDRVAYRHPLNESVLSIPKQRSTTRDGFEVDLDGSLTFQVVDPVKASYGVADYGLTIVQLAERLLREAIREVDFQQLFDNRTMFEERMVKVLKPATETWGIQILRYEVKKLDRGRA
jgi:regulator of protease activity HflC (stomatin/prohibitin superfamily)